MGRAAAGRGRTPYVSPAQLSPFSTPPLSKPRSRQPKGLGTVPPALLCGFLKGALDQPRPHGSAALAPLTLGRSHGTRDLSPHCLDLGPAGPKQTAN